MYTREISYSYRRKIPTLDFSEPGGARDNPSAQCAGFEDIYSSTDDKRPAIQSLNVDVIRVHK